ncbi:TPA: hypothetical protein N0F65_009815 [Lagenidium giganteum]|uniref:Cyclic nucleotide-binding domain-containing protein n=1 Tax=Lagenidium giganteum TaxID=4803 RepID=A0AAV2YQL9_9STRA|nr:TPA: hypothetical protein N0F65_009815 [Lagenidium giganteum]
MQPNMRRASAKPQPTRRRLSMTNALLGIGKSSRDIYEWQVKTANYEAMMQRFQLRKVASDASGTRPLSGNVVVDEATGQVKGAPQRFSLRRWFRSLWSHKKRKWVHDKMFPMTPNRFLTKTHSLVMLLTYHFQVFYLPFSVIYFPNGTSVTTAINIALEVIMMVDVLVRFNTAYMDKNTLVISHKKIAKRYLRGWFLIDGISSLPVHLVQYCSTRSHAQTGDVSILFDQLSRIPRLIHLRLVLNAVLFSRVLRVGKDVLAWLVYSRYSHLLGIAQLLWLVLMTSHYIACFWHVVAGPVGASDSDSKYSMLDKYVADFYYAICLIQGQGNSGGTLAQNAFSTMAVLVGSVILAIVFGNVAMLVSNFNANETNYQRKMEAVFATMSKMHLPRELRDRIHQYYVHLWEEYESLDGDIVKFSRELTHTLRLEVGLFKYMNLVVDIPFWKNCSPDFVTQIVLSLVVRVYLPDDYVIRKGEVGDEMFMINRGICEVWDATKVSIEDLADGTLSSRLFGNAANSDDEDDKPMTMEHAMSMTSRFGSQRSGNEDKLYDNMVHQRVEVLRPRLRRRIGNRIRMYSGHAFGEMSLLMNYAHTANIRAATYVEMCVLHRRDFQTLICRYAEDRKIVLTNMLKSCIDKKEIPFPWEQICDVVVLQRRTSFGQNCSREDVEKSFDSSEAAAALVERINVVLIDESIKYGFQGFDKPLEDPLPPTVLRRRASRLQQSRQARSVERTVSPSSGEATLQAPKQDIELANRVAKLEDFQRTMMLMMHSLSDAVGRSEQDMKFMKAQILLQNELLATLSQTRAVHDDGHEQHRLPVESREFVSDMSLGSEDATSAFQETWSVVETADALKHRYQQRPHATQILRRVDSDIETYVATGTSLTHTAKIMSSPPRQLPPLRDKTVPKQISGTASSARPLLSTRHSSATLRTPPTEKPPAMSSMRSLLFGRVSLPRRYSSMPRPRRSLKTTAGRRKSLVDELYARGSSVGGANPHLTRRNTMAIQPTHQLS